jgi:hypothetical protein
VEWEAAKGRNTAHAAPTVFSPLQNHCRITRRTHQLLLNHAAKWGLVCSLSCLIDCPSGLILGPSITLRVYAYSKYFCQRNNIASPFRLQPRRGRQRCLQPCSVLGNCRIQALLSVLSLKCDVVWFSTHRWGHDPPGSCLPKYMYQSHPSSDPRSNRTGHLQSHIFSSCPCQLPRKTNGPELQSLEYGYILKSGIAFTNLLKPSGNFT